MTNIQSIIAALPDEHLMEAIRGLKAFDETNAPGEGVFRQVVESIQKSEQTSDSDAVGFARQALLRAAAYKWAAAPSVQGKSSRRLSSQQACDRFLSLVRETTQAWAGYDAINEQQRCDGIAFTVLNIIDGHIGSFPHLELVANPHRDDKAYQIEQGDNYYEEGMVINDECALHEWYNNPPETSGALAAGSEPRAWTKAEVCQQVLDVMRHYAHYWATVPDKSTAERCDGLGFSLMNIFDGTTAGLPSFSIVARPDVGDKAHNIEQGLDYIVGGTVINKRCLLHELYYPR